MLSGYPVGCALRFAVDLDLATILVDGPCTIEDLAVFTETDRGVLERQIRALESVGVFRVNGTTVEVTELGASLARDGSLDPGAEPALEPIVLAPARADVDHRAPTDGVSTDTVSADRVHTAAAPVISSVLNDWTDEDFNRILATLCAATAARRPSDADRARTTAGRRRAARRRDRPTPRRGARRTWTHRRRVGVRARGERIPPRTHPARRSTLLVHRRGSPIAPGHGKPAAPGGPCPGRGSPSHPRAAYRVTAYTPRRP